MNRKEFLTQRRNGATKDMESAFPLRRRVAA
jgi:hypothetical protein